MLLSAPIWPIAMAKCARRISQYHLRAMQLVMFEVRNAKLPGWKTKLADDDVHPVSYSISTKLYLQALAGPMPVLVASGRCRCCVRSQEA